MYIASIILGYLFGSLPWALIIGKVFYKTDIRKHGSGNLGGTNAGRVLGKTAGIVVTILDALKALIVIGIVHYLCPEAAITSGLFCAIGHCFPIFANFKGGKAVATSFGFLLGASIFVAPHTFFTLFLVPLICFFILLYLSKMVSFASIGSLSLASIISIFVSNNLQYTLSIIVLTAFVVYRHRQNIKRILTKTEKKITWM